MNKHKINHMKTSTLGRVHEPLSSWGSCYIFDKLFRYSADTHTHKAGNSAHITNSRHCANFRHKRIWHLSEAIFSLMQTHDIMGLGCDMGLWLFCVEKSWVRRSRTHTHTDKHTQTDALKRQLHHLLNRGNYIKTEHFLFTPNYFWQCINWQD